ncbi:F-box protein SKIP27 [Acorus calamus]|uniref:F-box protein SKIP27 n=1 Tax=Acorus calamus TaxID=4465 RepID=A0AAV9E7T8_ACOCL|nr:F-box protein SKIP27 [Acorus calamus]
MKRARILGRKRVTLSKLSILSPSEVKSSPLESMLESLPPELLVKVLCGVEHSDLKQLILVSKAVGNAALIAKQTHFAYRTPVSSPRREDSPDMNAPMQQRIRSPMDEKTLASITVALFASP